MKRTLIACLALLAQASILFAVEKPYEAGKIVDIESKVNTRVLYYLGNTPITQDDPYYDVSVEVKNIVYVGEYTPRHSADTLPLGWDLQAPVQVRVEKHSLFVRRQQGRELELAVIKHFPSESPSSETPAAPASKQPRR
jgi:hypothetical protein